MSLDKAIEHKKEKRKQYRNSSAFDRSCRNHGSCPYCERNRTFAGKRAAMKSNTEEQVDEYMGYWNIPDGTDAIEAAIKPSSIAELDATYKWD
jgi:UDP-N-acetylglucosamine pyrophosphorylase